MCFTRLVVPMARKLRQQNRVLAYLDDFLICPVKAGRVVSMTEYRKATQMIDRLLSSLGLKRHPMEGESVWNSLLEHLGSVIDLDRIRFYIEPRKLTKIHGIARAILRQARQGRSWFRGTGYNRSVVYASHCPWQALCSLLHQKFIRRHDQKAQGKLCIKEWELLPVESSVDKGPADEEEIGEHRARWTLNLTASNQRNNAHKYSRGGFW
jgi:hypothetical protein